MDPYNTQLYTDDTDGDTTDLEVAKLLVEMRKDADTFDQALGAQIRELNTEIDIEEKKIQNTEAELREEVNTAVWEIDHAANDLAS